MARSKCSGLSISFLQRVNISLLKESASGCSTLEGSSMMLGPIKEVIVKFGC